MKTMQAREAKAHFSELLEAANNGEPTTITRHGTPIAVIMPIEAAERAYPQRKKTLGQILMEIPEGVEFERDYTPIREIDL